MRQPDDEANRHGDVGENRFPSHNEFQGREQRRPISSSANVLRRTLTQSFMAKSEYRFEQDRSRREMFGIGIVNLDGAAHFLYASTPQR
jgi:hypothetical protein